MRARAQRTDDPPLATRRAPASVTPTAAASGAAVTPLTSRLPLRTPGLPASEDVEGAVLVLSAIAAARAVGAVERAQPRPSPNLRAVKAEA